MGPLENENKIRIRRTNTQKAVLSAIAAAGIISVALIAPPVIGALGKIGIIPRKRSSEVVRSTASRLKDRGLLKFSNGYYSLTKVGENLLKQWEAADFVLTKPKRWDKKWRVVIFDIPEKKRPVRDRVRRLLNKSGMYRLQDSVWVYPYECEDIIGLLKSELGIGKDMLYLIVDQIESDKYLRHEFGLS